MDKKTKTEILLMCIPIIGTWWLIKRIIPTLGDITWWDYSKYSIPLTILLVFYQIICWVGYKVFYMMYFFGYSFNQVLNNGKIDIL